MTFKKNISILSSLSCALKGHASICQTLITISKCRKFQLTSQQINVLIIIFIHKVCKGGKLQNTV
jgi:hypothetical protein